MHILDIIFFIMMIACWFYATYNVTKSNKNKNIWGVMYWGIWSIINTLIILHW